MRTIAIVSLAGLAIASLAPAPAGAWSHSGYRGSISGGGGHWSALRIAG